MCHKNGSFLTVRFDGKIGKDGLGGFVQTHCVFRDVTREVQLQRQLELQEANLHQNQKLEAMGTLAGGIAHDFNNILAAVMGYTELSMEGTEPGTELHGNLMEVFAASNRAKDLVKQILTFSRQGDEEKQPINLCPLVHDAVKMMRSTTPTSIELYDSIDQSRVIVNGNASQINQILVNLVTNAVHAIEDNGTIELGIELVKMDATSHRRLPNIKPGSYARMFVTDSGEGISKDNLNVIFDPYFTTKPPEKGSGLGLAVVHGIVISHGGYIDVTSGGHGTTFEVFLPLSGGKELDIAPTIQIAASGGAESILVVDDEPSLARIQQRSLERLGYKVTVFSDSSAALAAVEQDPKQFDFLVTDMTMPGLNGMQLAEAVKQQNPEIYVLLCTGYSEEVNMDTWEATVLDGLFMKPVANEKLASAIRKLLDSKKQA